MGSKIIALAICWGVVIIASLGLALMMPVIISLSSDAAVAMDASANMSQQPGVMEATESMPYWSYAIAPLVGVGYTVYRLRKND